MEASPSVSCPLNFSSASSAKYTMGKKSKKKATSAPGTSAKSVDDAAIMAQLASLPISSLRPPSVPPTSPNLLPQVLSRVIALGETLPPALPEAEADWLTTALKVKYSLKGKQPWWWIFDDSLAAIEAELRDRSYSVLDDFLTMDHARAVAEDVKKAHAKGKLSSLGVVTDGRDGRNLSYERSEVRGDYIGWFDGNTQEGWVESGLPDYCIKVNTLVKQVRSGKV